MYVVVRDFTDKTDGTVYRAGEMFPRAGVEVSPGRIAELSSADNARGEVLIVPQKADIQPVRAENKSADESVAKAVKKPRTRKKKEK